jgi:hypothetical protein
MCLAHEPKRGTINFGFSNIQWRQRQLLAPGAAVNQKACNRGLA